MKRAALWAALFAICGVACGGRGEGQKPGDAAALTLLRRVPAQEDLVVVVDLVALAPWLEGAAGQKPSALAALASCLSSDKPAHRRVVISARHVQVRAGYAFVGHAFVQGRSLAQVAACARAAHFEVDLSPDGQVAAMLSGDGMPSLAPQCTTLDDGVFCRVTAGGGAREEEIEKAGAALDRAFAALPRSNAATDPRFVALLPKLDASRPLTAFLEMSPDPGVVGVTVALDRGLALDAVSSYPSAEAAAAKLPWLEEAMRDAAGDLGPLARGLKGVAVERRGADLHIRITGDAAKARLLGEGVIDLVLSFPAFAAKDRSAARFTTNQISLLLDAMVQCVQEEKGLRRVVICGCELDLSMSRTFLPADRDAHCAAHADLQLAQEKLDAATRRQTPFTSASPEIPAPGSYRLFAFAMPCKAKAFREGSGELSKLCMCFTHVLANRMARRTDLKTLGDVDAAMKELGDEIFASPNLCNPEE